MQNYARCIKPREQVDCPYKSSTQQAHPTPPAPIYTPTSPLTHTHTALFSFFIPHPASGASRVSVSTMTSPQHLPAVTDLEVTHRGLHRFIPRHHDEINIGIGDPIHVIKEYDDLWCEGKFTLIFLGVPP